MSLLVSPVSPSGSLDLQALPTEVKKLVDDELYTKYERMLYEITLSEMADVVFCPRTHCQLPVVVELGVRMD